MSLCFDEAKEDRLFALIKSQAGALACSKEHFSSLKERFKPLLFEVASRNFKVIIIAGTNGKGETAHSLNFLLHSQGLKTALWTSPHILSLRERFRFGDEDVSYEELEEALKQNEYADLGFYEQLFALFLKLVLRKNPEYLVLEVGMGGRFDAVNFLEPCLSLITSIARDHEKILGRGHRRILLEKLGVARTGLPLVTALELTYHRGICRDYSLERGIAWKDLFDTGELTKDFSYSKRNKLLALHAYKILRGEDLSFELLRDKSFKGRRESLVDGDRRFLFIGAHNHDGIRKMIEGLKSDHLANDFSCPFDTILVSFSKRPIEEISACLRLLVGESSLSRNVILTAFEHVKAMEGETLSKFKGLVRFEADWKTVLEQTKGSVLVTGSYYFVGEIQRYLYSRRS